MMGRFSPYHLTAMLAIDLHYKGWDMICLKIHEKFK